MKEYSFTEIIGTVPYLNGELFQQSEDEQEEIIFIPDLSFELIFTELFDRFNFTVTESTPLDEEVAVDVDVTESPIERPKKTESLLQRQEKAPHNQNTGSC